MRLVFHPREWNLPGQWPAKAIFDATLQACCAHHGLLPEEVVQTAYSGPEDGPESAMRQPPVDDIDTDALPPANAEQEAPSSGDDSPSTIMIAPAVLQERPQVSSEYQQKLKKALTMLGYGYEIVPQDANILPTDEILVNPYSAHSFWEKADVTVETSRERYAENCVFRRKIDVGAGYELVPAGALVQEGDERYFKGKWSRVWLPAPHDDEKVGGTYRTCDAYRRKIVVTPPAPKSLNTPELPNADGYVANCAKVQPEDGYVILPVGFVIEAGDRYFDSDFPFGWFNCVSPFGAAKTGSQGRYYARSRKVVPPAGFRLLNAGQERIAEGDLYLDTKDLQWKPRTKRIGEVYIKDHAYTARKIVALKKTLRGFEIPEGFYQLSKGTTIREDDLFHDNLRQAWIATEFAGSAVGWDGPYSAIEYIRKAETPKEVFEPLGAVVDKLVVEGLKGFRRAQTLEEANKRLENQFDQIVGLQTTLEQAVKNREESDKKVAALRNMVTRMSAKSASLAEEVVSLQKRLETAKGDTNVILVCRDGWQRPLKVPFPNDLTLFTGLGRFDFGGTVDAYGRRIFKEVA
jgi:hypothetical protein